MRSVGLGFIGAPIRETGSGAGSLPPHARVGAPLGTQARARGGGAVAPESRRPVLRQNRHTALKPFIIELFSGCQSFTRAVRRGRLRAFSFDINQGSEGDLSRKSVFSRIFKLLSSGQCRGIMIAPVCTTYSIARRPALRSKQRPRGLKDLNQWEQDQVDYANRLVDRTVAILDRACLLSTPWIVENPLSSLLWSERAFKRLENMIECRWFQHTCAALIADGETNPVDVS